MRRIKNHSIQIIILIFLISSNLIAQQNFWSQLNINVDDLIYNITITPQGKIFVGTSDGIYLSVDSGKTWLSRNMGLPSHPIINALASDKEGNIYTGVWTGGVGTLPDGAGVFKLNNNDTTWIEKNSGLSKKNVTAIAVNPNDSIIYLGTYNGGSFYLTGNDTSWLPMDTSLSDPHIGCFLVDTINNSVFVGTWSGVFRSTNAGKTWLRMGTSTSFIVNTMAINSKGYIFVGCSNCGVFRSIDSGVNWEPKDAMMGDSLVSNILINSKDVIYKSSSYGVFYSTNDGDTWLPIDGIPSVVSFFAFDINNYLYAGTKTGTVYRSNKSTITGVIENKFKIPNTFKLLQNYPNPVNPTTTISYTVLRTSFISIKVYDVLGKEVETLVNENKPVGNYSVEFNAIKSSSGIYFYRMQAGSFVDTKKLILLK
jgi:hypothetical protein